MTLRIEALAHDSRGIGFLPGRGRGRALFVPNVLPGDTILCRLDRDSGNFLEGSLLKLLDPGSNTVPPQCSHFEVCGGCPLRRMPYDRQLFWKENLLVNDLIRLGGIAASEIDAILRPIAASPQPGAYRNKLAFSFGCSGGGETVLGFRGRASHAVFSLRSCSLADSGALAIARWLENAARESGFKAGDDAFWKSLVLRKGHGSGGGAGWLALLLTGPASVTQKAFVEKTAQSLLEKIPECTAFVHEENGGRQGRKRILCLGKNGRSSAEAGHLLMRLGGRDFNIDAASFFQVNSQAAEILAEMVRDFDKLCSRKTGLLDLYCGSGVPGLLLAKNYNRGLGMELDSAAIVSARKNAARDEGWQYEQGDVARLLFKKKLRSGYSTVLLDPPRAGLDRAVCNWLNKCVAENIIYISCNSATFARDVKTLSQAWKLCQLGSVDMFPHTAHVECCALLEKKR